MTANKQLDRCKKYLRSTLLSNKGGVPAAELFKHYQDLVGESIPYKQFNFPTLEAFLSSIPDICQICWSGRDLMVMGVAGRASEHIEKMVSRQQNTKKAGGGRPVRCSNKPPRFGGGGGGGRGVGGSGGNGLYGASSVFSRLGGGGGARPAVCSESRNRPYHPSAQKVIQSPPAPVVRRTVPTSPRMKIDLKPSSVQSEKAYLETVGGKAVYGSRVENLLQGRQHGLYTSQVEKMYQKKYEQSLPTNWCSMLERDRIVRVEREVGSSPMVYPATSSGGQNVINNNMMNRNSISTVSLPSTAEWDITICSVTSTNQIHLWLGEADTQLTRMHTAMLSHHWKTSDSLSSANPPPVVGELYSALVGVDQCVRRVKVMQVDRSDYTAKCFMLDYGEEIVVKWCKLLVLDTKFAELPVQAVKATLAGVDAKNGPEEVNFVKKHLERRRLVGVVVGEEDRKTPALVLFDTSQEEDIMVSEEIIKYMSKIKDSSFSDKHQIPSPLTRLPTLASPRLPAVGEYYDLVVSSIVSPGMFYVQSHATLPAYTLLTTQMTNYYANNSSIMTITDFTPGSVCAVLVSSTWHRARLIRSLSSSLFSMRMVDTGRIMMASKELIKPLVKQFWQLPAQAIKANLATVDVINVDEGWQEEAVEWFKHIALNKSLVGLVEARFEVELVLTMYDTSVVDVDTVLNQEMVVMGLARKK